MKKAKKLLALVLVTVMSVCALTACGSSKEEPATWEDQFAGCMSLDTSRSAEEWIKICELRKSEDTCRNGSSFAYVHCCK